MIAFRGYAYTRTPSEVSGALMTRYDETTPQIWNVPLRDEIVPDLQQAAPKAGYLVPAAQAAMVAAKLRQHAVSYQVLSARRAGCAVGPPRHGCEIRRADRSRRQTRPCRASGERERVGAPGLYVPVAGQARLVVACSRRARHSLLAWGSFNTPRAQGIHGRIRGREWRARSGGRPGAGGAVPSKLASDPAFARTGRAPGILSPPPRVMVERLNLYPVLRTDAARLPAWIAACAHTELSIAQINRKKMLFSAR